MSSPSSAESQPTSIVPNTSEVTTTTTASTTSAVTTTASYPPVLTTTTATTTATILPTTNNMNNNNSFLSEQEDNDVSLSSSITRNKIEVSECDGADYDDDDDGADDESEYSYDYEEDDDGHYTGFIVSSSSPSLNQAQQQQQQSHDTIGKAAVVPRDDIVDDYDENDEKNYRKNNNDSNSTNNNDDNSNTENDHIQFASLEQTNTTIAKKSTWKEPSQQAVSMSLRVESEKTGGRRRLAADLYKIMMHDTNEAGFSVESADEESMDKWTIKLFKFDEDSNLHKDMLILGLDHIELEMNFPDQYPFEPPFVRVVRPRFKKQTGFVMNGALCMELLTNDGWNPINDIESVIVSIRSLLVVGDGRLEAAANLSEDKRKALLAAAMNRKEEEEREGKSDSKDNEDEATEQGVKRKRENDNINRQAVKGYSTDEAKAAYTHLSSYHKKKGWSGWWNQRG